MLSERHRRIGLDRVSSTEKSRERRQLSRKMRETSCSPRPKQQQQATAVRPSVRPSEMNESRPSHERSSLVTIYANGVRMCIHPALLCSRPSALTLNPAVFPFICPLASRSSCGCGVCDRDCRTSPRPGESRRRGRSASSRRGGRIPPPSRGPTLPRASWEEVRVFFFSSVQVVFYLAVCHRPRYLLL